MKKILQKIFSIKREEKHKVLTILGLKIKYKSENRLKTIQNLIEIQEYRLNEITDRINAINFKQNLVMDYFLNPSDALPASGALKKRQDENLMLIKEFSRICEKFNLDYWLDFGTLLGYKRHNGFIPWDDDIDVSMKRSDFKRLIDVIFTEKQDNFNFLHWEEAGQSRLIFANDTGAFLDIYEYEESENYVKSIPVFNISAYNEPINKDILYPLKDTTFIGVKVKIPANTETYLRIKYGNFNVLPKKSHVIGGHNKLNEHFID